MSTEQQPPIEQPSAPPQPEVSRPGFLSRHVGAITILALASAGIGAPAVWAYKSQSGSAESKQAPVVTSSNDSDVALQGTVLSPNGVPLNQLVLQESAEDGELSVRQLSLKPGCLSVFTSLYPNVAPPVFLGVIDSESPMNTNKNGLFVVHRQGISPETRVSLSSLRNKSNEDQNGAAIGAVERQAGHYFRNRMPTGSACARASNEQLMSVATILGPELSLSKTAPAQTPTYLESDREHHGRDFLSAVLGTAWSGFAAAANKYADVFFNKKNDDGTPDLGWAAAGGLILLGGWKFRRQIADGIKDMTKSRPRAPKVSAPTVIEQPRPVIVRAPTAPTQVRYYRAESQGADQSFSVAGENDLIPVEMQDGDIDQNDQVMIMQGTRPAGPFGGQASHLFRIPRRSRR